MHVPSNWFESFFHGVAVDLWLQAVPPEHTREEAARLEQRLELTPGAEVLDVPCGAGRLTLELAAAVTSSPASICRPSRWHTPARQVGARGPNGTGRVTWAQRDIRELPWPDRFDAASVPATASATWMMRAISRFSRRWRRH